MSPSEMSRRTMLGGVAIGASAVLLAACSRDGTPSGATQTPTSRSVTVTDQLGKKTAFGVPVHRIVTIPMPAASLLVAVDQTVDHLTAMHAVSWTAMRDGIMSEMFPRVLTIPHDIAQNDFTPNVESIRALDPDVVVQWSDARLTAPLGNAGLKVLDLQNNGTQQDVDRWISMFAAILGKPERAIAMKARSDAEQRAIAALASSRTGKAPSILYFNRFVGGLKVAGKQSYNDFYIKLVGATNPASADTGVPGSGMVGVDVEQVLAWNPEIILLGNFDAAEPSDIYGNPVWQNVSAVKSRRVYKVPLGGYRWDPPGQESPLMWRWLSDIAYPVAASPLRRKLVSYYDFLYAHKPTTAQMDKILMTAQNSQSAHYKQFDAA